ncbi:hypothetical protein BV898_19020 [Hypsibius exemplaris]|uniref:Receptor ligand binding region domain-containing protein n=1 Tax=Hypsibius exemplaris TaxID=2072580 RepID=A0A9X6RPD1_HYPEX|nr:hypothetical protein BV898_19020 [Hypsibius exemplaris]
MYLSLYSTHGYLVTFLVYAVRETVLVQAIPLNLVGIFISLNSTGYSPGALEPIFDLTLREMTFRYPETFRGFTWTKMASADVSACSVEGRESAIQHMASLYQQGRFSRRNGRPVIFAPLACPMAFYPVADMAREMDVLVGTCAITNVAYVEKGRFPTVLSFSSVDMSAHYAAVTSVVQHFNWKNVAVISDAMTRSDSRVNVVNQEMCRALVALLQDLDPIVNVLEVQADSTTQNWTTPLRIAHEHSRIVLTCTAQDRIRSLLLEAADLHMADGDYVFLLLYRIVNWRRNDSSDEKVSKMLPSTMVVQRSIRDASTQQALQTPRERPSNNSLDTSSSVQRSSNVSEMMLTMSEYLRAVAMPCIDNLEIVAQVMHEVSSSSATYIGGRELARTFYNRSFTTLLTESEVKMTSRGTRRSIIDVLQFNSTQQDFESVLIFDSATFKLQKSSTSRVRWKSGSDDAPPDRVPCMIAERCRAEQEARRNQEIAAGASCATVFSILLVAGFIEILRRRQSAPDSFWWWLSDHNLRSHNRIPAYML